MERHRLDDMYRMIAHIYSEQNAQRSPSATFAHFVEVCGMLTVHERRKKREGLAMDDALCKAIGWYFPLLAKFRVRSVEELVYRKYPFACPYCRLERHNDAVCKTVRGTAPTVNHEALRQKRAENNRRRPSALNDWQEMFQIIYPRSTEDRSARSTLGLMEELGELAEAVRVFDRHPKYFAGEAADVFSYLMGIANEHSLRMQQEGKGPFSFEAELLRRYPGLCVQCGHKTCICPAIPESTVGRMAKELSFDEGDDLFFHDASAFEAQAIATSSRVLEALGGYRGVLSQFPFDRGEANNALILLCLRLADALQGRDPAISHRLQALAIQVGQSATFPGSRAQRLASGDVIGVVRAALDELDLSEFERVVRPRDLGSQLGKTLKTLRYGVPRREVDTSRNWKSPVVRVVDMAA